MAKIKSVDINKKHEQELIERLRDSGDLYNENLGEWRVVPNISTAKDMLVVGRGNKEAGAAALLGIELFQLLTDAVTELSAIQRPENGRLSNANSISDALLGHPSFDKRFQHFSDRGSSHDKGMYPATH